MSQSLELVRVGYYRAPAVRRVTPFQIRDGECLVELMTNGRAYIDLDGHSVMLTYGDFRWEYPGDWSLSHTDPEDPYECITFLFRIPENQKRQWPGYVRPLEADILVNFAREALHAFHAFHLEREELGPMIYNRLAWETYRSNLHQQPAEPSVVTLLRAFIERHYGSHLELQDLAEEAQMSVSNLFNLFHRYFAMSPMQYVRERRLYHARLALVETGDSIRDIAEACGFSNVEVFCRTFRQAMGITPGQYRKRYRGPQRLTAETSAEEPS
ncbi:MAG: AraC family transcriptional regulator [Lentisphaerae bacterium]|nr:MAG: AraC family transcriptional regulator [Lentisphaerota bacterium]